MLQNVFRLRCEVRRVSGRSYGCDCEDNVPPFRLVIYCLYHQDIHCGQCLPVCSQHDIRIHMYVYTGSVHVSTDVNPAQQRCCQLLIQMLRNVMWCVRRISDKEWRRILNTFLTGDPRFHKEDSFLKSWRCRPLVLLTRVTLWWKWVTTIGGVTLTGETEVLAEKRLSVPRTLPQIWHGLIWDRTVTSAVRSRRLTAWVVARPDKGKITLNYI